MDRSVHQNSTNESTDLFHMRQLCPLKVKSVSVSRSWHPSHLVSVRIVGLHAAEDRLVLAEASTDIDPALVSHHGTPEPVITDWIRRRREGEVLLDCGDRLLSN